MILTLVGSPNTGKSTLFNQLTGLKSKVINYPGSTVDLYRGFLQGIEIWDTPGIYSLRAQSEDERLTLKQVQRSDFIVLVLDVTQLARQLELLKQVIGFNKPFMIVLTMVDLIEKLGINFDLKCFEKLVGVRTVFNSCFHVSDVLSLKLDLSNADVRPQFELLEEFISNYQKPLNEGLVTWSLRWDRYALHPIIGILVFLALMLGLLTSIFWFSDPFIRLIEVGFSVISSWVEQAPNFSGQEFLAKAVLPGLSSFLVFIPQIFILFFLLSALEASGYLARAAFIADSVLRQFGVSGRAFVPLLSGFACAIPALLAARNLSSERERTVTRWVVPLFACSARIPVFSMLVASTLKGYGPEIKAIGLMCLYLVSLIPAAFTALFLDKFFNSNQNKQKSLLLLEMPWYRKPSIRVAFLNSIQKSYLFVMRAGPLIFVLSVGIYLLSTYPKANVEGGEILITESYLGQFANALEPVFRPMGLDGQSGVAVLSAFAAREVFVSTLAMVRSVEESDEHALSEVFGIPASLGLMFFFMVALQCLSTVALQAKESGSWKMAITQLAVFNSVAYLGAVTIYQIANYLGL